MVSGSSSPSRREVVVRCCLVVFAVASALFVSGPALYWKFKKNGILRLSGGGNVPSSCGPCVCDCPPPLPLLNISPEKLSAPLGFHGIRASLIRNRHHLSDPTIPASDHRPCSSGRPCVVRPPLLHRPTTPLLVKRPCVVRPLCSSGPTARSTLLLVQRPSALRSLFQICCCSRSARPASVPDLFLFRQIQICCSSARSSAPVVIPDPDPDLLLFCQIQSPCCCCYSARSRNCNPLGISCWLLNLSVTDCGRDDPDLNVEMEKQFVDLLTEEMQLQEAVSKEYANHMNLTFIEVRRLASQYQKEAEKCNTATETCEGARERAEAALTKEKKVTAAWEKRARQLGWVGE